MTDAATTAPAGFTSAEQSAPTRRPAGSPAAALDRQGPAKRAPGAKRRVLSIVALVVLGGGGWYGYQWWTEGRFFVSTDDAYVRADMAVIAAKVSGYVATVGVTDNTAVKAGDLLATIDDGDYRLAVEAARRKLETQDATIARIGEQGGAQQALVEQAQAALEAARADAQRAATEYDRAQSLAKSGFATQQRLDQALADRDRSAASVTSSAAAVSAARANLSVIGAQKIEAQRTRGELQTALDRAQRDLTFTEIRAPFDGVVGNRAIQPGLLVQPGTRLLALIPLQSAYVEANFKETQLARLKPGQKVHFTVDASGSRGFDGTVDSFAPASGSQYSLLPPENATGNFTKIVQRVPVRIRVPASIAAEGVLRPGLSVIVDVDTREPKVTAAEVGTASSGRS